MRVPPIDPVVLAGELEEAVSAFNRLAALASQQGMAVVAELRQQAMPDRPARPVLAIQVALPGTR